MKVVFFLLVSLKKKSVFSVTIIRTIQMNTIEQCFPVVKFYVVERSYES